MRTPIIETERIIHIQNLMVLQATIQSNTDL